MFGITYQSDFHSLLVTAMSYLTPPSAASAASSLVSFCWLAVDVFSSGGCNTESFICVRGYLLFFFAGVVLSDGLHDIRSSPVVTCQGILQGEGSVSGPSHSSTHCCAAQLQSNLMHNFAQIFLSFIQTLHLCKKREKISNKSCKYPESILNELSFSWRLFT